MTSKYGMISGLAACLHDKLFEPVVGARRVAGTRARVESRQTKDSPVLIDPEEDAAALQIREGYQFLRECTVVLDIPLELDSRVFAVVDDLA
jgi:hypothetical protein